MIKKEDFLNKGKIFYRLWHGDIVNDIIIISHGLAEHSGRYEHVASYFVNLGYAVYAIDHFGHGKSEGNRGHAESFNSYTVPLEELIRFARSAWKKEKVILLGHSLGAVIAHYYVIHYPEKVKALILTSPGYEKKIPPPKIKAAIGKLLAGILPKLALGNELDAADISRDTEVVVKYKTDPLVHSVVTTRFFTSFLAAMVEIENFNKEFTFPFFYFVAGADRIVSAETSRRIYEKLNCKNKSFKLYENLYHEILNEKEQLTVLKDIEESLKKII
jgi:acylglycerol lipase